MEFALAVKVSIITAVFNRFKTIGETLQSVQSQSYKNIEHIIQDGGSTDGTLEIIKSKTNSTTNLESLHDAGIYDAINKGIRRATGDVIGLMHSDDIFPEENIIEIVAKAFEDPEIDGLYGDLQYVAYDDTHRIIRQWVSGPYKPENFKKGWMPPHPTVYLRSNIFKKFGLYDTSYQIAADYDAMLRYMGCNRIKMAYLPKVMVKMRTGGISNRSLKHIIQKSREDYLALRSNNMGGAKALIGKNLSKLSQFVNKS